MFSYYGTKRKLAGLYPDPGFDTIIEPFAGAAGYSLHGNRWRKKVKLFDANPKVIAVWNWLIHADELDILTLPDIGPGDCLTDYKLPDPIRWLIGFCINPGSTSPKLTATKRSKWQTNKSQIRADIHKVNHWTVELKSYADIPNEPATWHIDPPYQKAGKYYFGPGRIDFGHLGQWARARRTGHGLRKFRGRLAPIPISHESPREYANQRRGCLVQPDK